MRSSSLLRSTTLLFRPYCFRCSRLRPDPASSPAPPYPFYFHFVYFVVRARLAFFRGACTYSLSLVLCFHACSTAPQPGGVPRSCVRFLPLRRRSLFTFTLAALISSLWLDSYHSNVSVAASRGEPVRICACEECSTVLGSSGAENSCGLSTDITTSTRMEVCRSHPCDCTLDDVSAAFPCN